jgi:hypothetical protein
MDMRNGLMVLMLVVSAAVFVVDVSADQLETVIAQFPEGVAAIAASYNYDDNYQIVLVATKNGDLHDGS